MEDNSRVMSQEMRGDVQIWSHQPRLGLGWGPVQHTTTEDGKKGQQRSTNHKTTFLVR